MDKLKAFFNNNPLKAILLIALIARLFAAIFSGGYAMHDDHFLIIESSSSWADGDDYNNWLPSTQKAKGIELHAEGHSLTYPGIHYFFFETFNALGIDNPLFQMFLVRLIHAIFGLWLVYLGYKITEKISNKKNAIGVGLILSIAAVMPFLAVRNLVEMVCIPFYLYGIWQIIKHQLISETKEISGIAYKIKDGWKAFFIAGIFFGFAFAIRFQLAVFFGVLGFVFALQFKWRACIAILLGFVVSVCLTQGVVDYMIWGKPFEEFMAYAAYNSESSNIQAYTSSSHWFTYPLILSVMTLPIVGLFYWAGNFKLAIKYAWLFFPMMAFTLFHVFYPNHQERFIFPMLPVFLILGVIGMSLIRKEVRFFVNRPKFWKIILIVGWSLSSILLPFFTTFYGKQSRIEAAYHIYPERNRSLAIIQEDVISGKATMFPRFYAGNWKINTNHDFNNQAALDNWAKNPTHADFIYLVGSENIEERTAFFKKFFPNISYEKTVEPSFMDEVLYFLNPRNKNQSITILRTNEIN